MGRELGVKGCREKRFSALKLTNNQKKQIQVLNNTFALPFRYGRHEIVEALLSGRNIRSINLKNSQGKTALHFACVEGHDRVVERLLNLGATVEK